MKKSVEVEIMNDIVKMAQEMDQYNNNLPNVEQGRLSENSDV